MGDWMALDDATLSAAFDFIDGFPIEAATCAPPLPTRLSDAAASTRAAQTGKTCRSRSQKEVLWALRLQAAQLEERITSIRKEYAIATDSQIAVRGDGANGSGRRPLASAWEAIASRQRKQRQRAELENTKLRETLQEHLRTAAKLQRLIKKRCWRHQQPENPLLSMRLCGDLNRVTFQQSCQELMATVHQMNTQIDKVFQAPRFVSLTVEDNYRTSEVVATKDPSRGQIIELFSSEILPFDLHSVSDAIWHHMAHQTLAQDSLYDRVHTSTDTKVEREFGSVIDMPQMKALFLGKAAGRRYSHDDTVVILWTVVTDMKTLPGDAKPVGDCVAMTQQGWTVLRPLPHELQGQADAGTLSQTYHVSTPELDGIPDRRRRPTVLANCVLGIRFHMEESTRMIENLLLAKSLPIAIS